MAKNPPANARDSGDTDSIPGLGKYPRGGSGNPLQYSCLENSIDRGAWWATVLRVAKSQTQLSTQACMIFNKGLISKMYKELIKLNIKKKET